MHIEEKDGRVSAAAVPAHWDKRRKAAATIAAGVALEGVSRRFGATLAVDAVTLTIAPGEVVCLLGPSGCGKTTLLRMIAGIERPDAGRVVIGGVEVSSARRFVPPEARGVGLMFQDFALFPHLRIIDNVAFGLKRLGRDTARREAQAALDRIGLGAFANDYPHILSGGQQQRVALARAIVPRPAVLLMDEPFSGLDTRLRHAIREETLGILREARATALVVTHDPEEAMRVGDRVAVMREGRLVQTGTAEALYQRPADIYVAETFSEVNVVSCLVRDGMVASPLGVFKADGVPDGEAVYCLRQNEIEIALGGEGCPAQIVDAKFLGAEALIELTAQGIEPALVARFRGDGLPPKGTEVVLRVDPRRVMVFPADANGIRRS